MDSVIHMEQRDEIVVVSQFLNAIDANIAKTKLDAHGVPCFLTEENMANLYPGQEYLPFRVRLHIFKKDIDNAKKILDESNLQLSDADNTCPQCHSKRVVRDFPKSFSINPWSALAILFF
ncbi:MAG: DUF2007 domain-containing protein, partial [Bacteroidota bacterium]